MLGADYEDHDLIFAQPNGKPEHAHNIVRRDFQKVMERAGVPRLKFHDLRHAFASYSAEARVPVKVTQELLGHATPDMTTQVYTHTLDGQHIAAVKAVQAYVLGTAD